MRRFAAAVALTRLTAITAVALPLQMLAVRANWRLASTLPVWWHRRALEALATRIRITGAPVVDRPLLVTPNHSSWIDIPVIASLIPTSWVPEGAGPAWLLFVPFATHPLRFVPTPPRRTATGSAASELGGRLADGDCMVLFPEGTSWRGDEVLPFRSALLGAARNAILHGGHERVWVQPLTIAYKRLGGLPIGRAERARVGWYGDTELPGHLWGIFLAGGLDVEVIWGEALPFDETTNRKKLAADLEATVRRDLLAALRP